MTKYSLTLTASPETLFGILAKLLPDDLHIHVEEVPDHAPKAMFDRGVALARIAEMGKSVPTTPSAKLAAPKHRPKRRATKPLDLKSGINAILMEAMAEGKSVRATDLRPLLTARGFSGNSVGSRLQNLREHDVVRQNGDGTWQLKAGVIV